MPRNTKQYCWLRKATNDIDWTMSVVLFLVSKIYSNNCYDNLACGFSPEPGRGGLFFPFDGHLLSGDNWFFTFKETFTRKRLLEERFLL